MTEKDIYKNGVAVLEEWEDVNYCEHSFKFKDEWLTDKEVVDLLNELATKCSQLKKENEELKQRNNRQAKQLDHLYNLIEEKDWRTLSDILDDFKRCEEQLQKEWGTYGDVE